MPWSSLFFFVEKTNDVLYYCLENKQKEVNLFDRV
jgi:hypothetical protein